MYLKIIKYISHLYFVDSVKAPAQDQVSFAAATFVEVVVAVVCGVVVAEARSLYGKLE
jgi:hypothetical protein